MANPTFFSEGSSEHRWDTKWKVLQKILAVVNELNAKVGGSMSNPTFFSEGSAEHRQDPKWKILQKILGGLNALNSAFSGMYSGNGDPNGVLAASVGAFYTQKDGGGTVWAKVSGGSGNTGWAINA